MTPVQLRAIDDRAAEDWLTGSPMDPSAIPAEPMPTLPGFPFVHAGAG